LRNRKHKLVGVDKQLCADITPFKSPKVRIIPRNMAQEEYAINLDNPQKRIVVASGPAGTGKSYMCVLQASKELKEGDAKKIIITRPTVAVNGEQIGFLPGSLNQKMEPWTQPIFDVFEEHYTKKQIAEMMEDGIIEIAPFAFMRGRTFKHCIIIADESQNTTPEQMKMLLSRIGENSRIFVNGDTKQTDIRSKNGLQDFIERVGDKNPNIGICFFTTKHIERDPMVAEVLRLYGEE